MRGKDKVHKKGQVNKHKPDFKKTTDYKAGSFYCTEHGKNTTHNTDACFVLNGKKKGTAGAQMTKQSFRSEIHLLSRKRPKKQVLEMFAAVLNKERANASNAAKKAKSRKKKRKNDKKTPDTSESSSDSRRTNNTTSPQKAH